MSIKYLTRIFVCAGALCFAGTSVSCSQSDEDHSARYIQHISENISDVDPIRMLRAEDHSETLKNSILAQIADSCATFKAVAIVVILDPQDAARYVLDNPSRELITSISETYTQISDITALSSFTASVDERFKALNVAHQALFVTAVAEPAECAKSIEPGDDELCAEIKKIYAKQSQSALDEFTQNLKDNN